MTLEEAIYATTKPEQKTQYDLLIKLEQRSKSKAELEKEAKAKGLWDYRNNKIVEE